MSIFDNLKNIFKVDFKFSKLKEIHFISDNKIDQKFIIDKRNITINIGQLSETEIPKLQELLKTSVKKDDNLILEKSANILVKDLKTVENKKENIDLVDFFRGKIRYTDLEILLAS